MADKYTARSVKQPARSHTIYETLDDRELFFYDEFDGSALNTTKWATVEVGLNTAIAHLSAVHGGVLAQILDADNNDEDALMYFGDMLSMDVNKALYLEMRCRCAVLPTLTAEGVWGMAGTHNLDKDTINVGAWFKLDGSGALVVESDDTTNNEDDEATGITMAIATWYVLSIDFKDLANVKFYVDNVRVATQTTFDMTNLTAAEAIMQVYFGLDKTSDVGLGTFYTDYVKVWSQR